MDTINTTEDGIPAVLMTAKDTYALFALYTYRAELGYDGHHDDRVDVERVIQVFEDWRVKNSDKIEHPNIRENMFSDGSYDLITDQSLSLKVEIPYSVMDLSNLSDFEKAIMYTALEEVGEQFRGMVARGLAVIEASRNGTLEEDE